MYDKKISEEVKSLAVKLGVDLVGIAPVDRFKNAPLRMSPKGHLPTAKSVIVIGVHHLDAAIELGGEPTPHDFGPYSYQSSVMNPKLDSVAFRLAEFLEKNGYAGLPMPVTNIWRYRPYKEIEQSFAPDLVHRYAAVAAGLGEIGWSGLFLSPEFGPRQRVNSIITDASLEPDPMYEGQPLCDKCMECVKACPTKALKEEIKKINELEIGGKVFKFPDTNKWRCAWAENFALSLHLDIPEKVNEEVILEHLAKHGQYGGEMGSCLRYCMTPQLRYEDKKYTRVWRRKREIKKVSSEQMSSKLKEIAKVEDARQGENGLDWAVSGNLADFKKKNINLRNYLPDAERVICIGLNYNDDYTKGIAWRRLRFVSNDIAQYLEKIGYSSVVGLRISDDLVAKVLGLYGTKRNFLTIFTAAEVDIKILPHLKKKKKIDKKKLTKKIKSFALSMGDRQGMGANLVGITSVKRLEQIHKTLKSEISKEKIIDVRDASPRCGGPFVPVVSEKKLIFKRPKDYLTQAKSVIVLGIHYPHPLIDRAGLPPAEAVGPYAAHAQTQTLIELESVAFDVSRLLESLGYKSVITPDLSQTASLIENPRYIQVDATANRYAAISAGLGELGWHGMVITPQYGIRQRFISIITDANLESDPLYSGPSLCKKCYKCVESCIVNAISRKEKVSFKVEKKTFEYGKLKRLHCDWVKRYGLVGDEGPKYMGSKTDILPPDKITVESLTEALKKMDPLQKRHLCILEKCLVACKAGLNVKGS